MPNVSLPNIKAAHKLHFNTPQPAVVNDLTALELEYFKAYSQFRRRNYEKCVELCNTLLEANRDNNTTSQLFTDMAIGNNAESRELSSKYNSFGSVSYNTSSERTGGGAGGGGAKYQQQQQLHATTATGVATIKLLEGVWQLKMRALTQRVYVDDLETNDADDEVNEELEFERIAKTARPGTSIKSAFVQRPNTSIALNRQRSHQMPPSSIGHSREGRQHSSGAFTARPTSAMARPGTSGISRPGSAVGSTGRSSSRCATASRVRATSAAAFTFGDTTAPLYQASRLNPTIYAERHVLVKTLFQFLFYHEADLQKAYELCDAVINAAKQRPQQRSTTNRESNTTATAPVDWWWSQQLGRTLLTLKYPRKAEAPLQQSLAAFAHPDTYLLLSRLYQRLNEPQRALELITTAVDRHPFDVVFRIEQGRILDVLNKPESSLQIFRLISRLNPINIEALACVALSYFYDNNPEMALMYYRRILALGVHTAELYCNIALCCLYGGQIDLVLPCFMRALNMADTNDQKAAIWYNLSFVAITTGDFDLARRCLQLCLTCDGRNGSALNNLAVLAANSGDILKAKTYLNAAKEVLGEDSNELTNNLQYMNEHYKL